MKKLYFIRVEEEYINYLRKYDNKVQDNSNIKCNKPYLGILLEKEKQKYFVPLSSPKRKHSTFIELEEKNKLPIDVFLIRDSDNKLLGIMNFNNMIPVIDEVIIHFNIKQDKDYSLLKKEHIYCVTHQDEILKKAIKIYELVTKYKKQSLIKRSCDFLLLENKCKQYKEFLKLVDKMMRKGNGKIKNNYLIKTS